MPAVSTQPNGLAAPEYAGLRDIADRLLAAERRDHTLQATALAHEAWLRLHRSDAASSEHLQLATRVMREVLVDHARRRSARKRGGDRVRRPLHDERVADASRPDVLEIDDAIGRLAAVDAEAARIVELRFFGGLNDETIARVLGCSTRSVRRGWQAARLWLARELRA